MADTGPLVLTEHLECFYCGFPVRYGAATFDHIVPRSRTPMPAVDHPSNMVVACRSCNSSKNDRTWAEWIDRLLAKRFSNGLPVEPLSTPREDAVVERRTAIDAMISFRDVEWLLPGKDQEQHMRSRLVDMKTELEHLTDQL